MRAAGVTKQPGMTRAVYRHLLDTYGRELKYWVGFVAGLAQSVSGRVGLAILQAQIVAAVARGDVVAARWAIVWYLALGAAGLVVRYVRDTVGIVAENNVYTKHMVMYYDKLVGKDLAFYRDHQTGYLAGTFRQHSDAGLVLARLLRNDIQQTVVLLVLPMAVLLYLSWPVGLVVLAVVLLQLAYVIWVSRLTEGYRQATHELYRRVSGLVSDDVTNIVAYKSSGNAGQSREQMVELSRLEEQAFTKRRVMRAKLETPRDALTFAGAGVALWLAVSLGAGGLGSVGLLVLVIIYMVQVYNAVQAIPGLIDQHDDLITKIYPTLEYLTDEHETIRDPQRPLELPRKGGAVEFNDVTFGYDTTSGRRVEVFKDLSLNVAAGEQVGIVGLSGAGKSTLASLLMRFDDINAGAITIDRVDIRQVKQADLRERIAFVPQEPLLFHRTIRENMTYFNRHVTQDELERAARAAHAHEFIMKLPDGYDTLVGERGVKLSGGQKQRIVLARSILKDADIMVFDEATSALDSSSEKIIQAALPGIIGKRTAIVIAHRLSTVAGLDRIVVMENGRIVESGTHDELLKLGGRYADLWQKQSSAHAEL